MTPLSFPKYGFAVKSAASVVAVMLISGTTAVEARELTPHKAIYEMRMMSADSETQLSDVTGQNEFSLTRECDGYVVAENYMLEFSYGSGETAIIASQFQSWEHIDGGLYSFSVHEGSNFEPEKKFDGYAYRPPQVAEPEAFFSMQPNSALPLPKAVYFPLAHTLDLLDKADKGEKLFSADLFFGTEPDKAIRRTNSVIGKAQETGEIVKMGSLTEPFYYPVQIAYFDPKSSVSVPEYEHAFHLQPNGVVSYYEINYGDFSVDAQLVEIEALPPPICS